MGKLNRLGAEFPPKPKGKSFKLERNRGYQQCHQYSRVLRDEQLETAQKLSIPPKGQKLIAAIRKGGSDEFQVEMKGCCVLRSS